MGPAVDGAVQENQLSDEDYVIHRAKCSQKLDDATAKAWMITAKTLFPRNFAVQLEAYTSQKAANNPKEAARHFSTLFFDFRNEAGLWDEVQGITEALQAGVSSDNVFHRELFAHLLPDVQHDLLLAMAERAKDPLEHCQLILVLINKLPQSIDIQGKKLVDTLLSAEKQSLYQTPVNCFRKLLVFDLLPMLLASKTVDIPTKQLNRLIVKAIEFYVCWLTGGPVVQGMEETELKPGDAFKELFKIMFALGRKLGWELTSIFANEEGTREIICQNLWAFYRSTPIGNEESPNFGQLLYSTIVLLFESLYEYFARLDPTCFQTSNPGGKGDSTPLLLVYSFFPISGDSSEPSVMKLCKDEISAHQAVLPVTVTRSCPPSTAAALVSSFLTAVSCWELLHQTEDLRNAFSRICAQLQTERWTWLPAFVTDGVLIYQGLYADALSNLQSSTLKSFSPLALLLKSAGIFVSLGNPVAAVEQVLHVMGSLPEGGTDSLPYPVVRHPSTRKPPLHFMAMGRSEMIQYCVSILVACFRDTAFRSGSASDLAAGHLVVLLQYDWPQNAGLMEEILEKIRRQGHFTYPLFVSYIIHVDILEEFAYLATDQGGAINLDIFPSTSQLSTQRRMTTRRGDLGAREEFRMCMKRQMSRSPEDVQTLITRFILQERNFLLQALT